MSVEGDVIGWWQWVATGLVGLVTIMLGGTLRQTSARVDMIEKTREQHFQLIREERERGDDKLWKTTEDLRLHLQQHQNEMHQAQLLITARLAEIPTRIELRLELERLAPFQRGKPSIIEPSGS